MNAHELSQIMKREICDELDHKNLNLEVDWLQGLIQHAEVVVMKIWERIEPLIPSARLHSIRLQKRLVFMWSILVLINKVSTMKDDNFKLGENFKAIHLVSIRQRVKKTFDKPKNR